MNKRVYNIPMPPYFYEYLGINYRLQNGINYICITYAPMNGLFVKVKPFKISVIEFLQVFRRIGNIIEKSSGGLRLFSDTSPV